ncbi:MAG: hypothetical protein HYV28_21320, partial [Ignavibacteriales bacterium]|nr:hypothetical protein [Ignavibacteriales bacterium]
TYDGRGNVTGNSLSNLQDIVYDTRNLPLQMVTGMTADTVYYGYDDAGHRTRKEVNGEKTWYLYDPAGRELGTFKMVPEVGAIKLKSYNLQGNGGSIGRVDVNYTRTGPFINEGDTTYSYTRNDVANYYIKDHLGSVRATMQRANTIFAEDTYPFGASQQRYEDGGTAPQRFDFTGKERDRESGLHYFGARNYDSDLGIWYGVDPLADKYPGLSPYNYCINNPVNSVDPDGRDVWDFLRGTASAVAANLNPSYKAPSIQSQKGDVDDYATGRLVGNAISVAVGVAEVIAGDAGMAAGAAITVSGAGAVIGVPLAVASAGVAAHGVATTASAAVNLGKDVNSMKSQSNGKGGGEQQKKLSKGEIKKLEKGGVDVHDLKKSNGDGKSDLYKSKDGTIYVKPKKSSGTGEPTNHNIKDY